MTVPGPFTLDQLSELSDDAFAELLVVVEDLGTEQSRIWDRGTRKGRCGPSR